MANHGNSTTYKHKFKKDKYIKNSKTTKNNMVRKLIQITMAKALNSEKNI